MLEVHLLNPLETVNRDNMNEHEVKVQSSKAADLLVACPCALGTSGINHVDIFVPVSLSFAWLMCRTFKHAQQFVPLHMLLSFLFCFVPVAWCLTSRILRRHTFRRGMSYNRAGHPLFTCRCAVSDSAQQWCQNAPPQPAFAVLYRIHSSCRSR